MENSEEKTCEKCYFVDEETGSCTNDLCECVNNNAFVRKIEPEDMYKALFMLIYNLGGQIEVSPKDLEKLDDDNMKIEHEYDPEAGKYLFFTNPQPPPKQLIMIPKKFIKGPRARQPIKIHGN